MHSMLKDWPLGVCNFNKSEHLYSFKFSPSDERKILLSSYEMGEKLRGSHPHLLITDETKDMPYDMFGSIILPKLGPVPEKGFKGGKAVLIGTVYYDCIFKELWHRGVDPNYPDWCSFSINAVQSGVFTKTDLDTRRINITPAQFAQEYMCDWEAKALYGAVYLDHITRMPHNFAPHFLYDPTLPVWTAWDIGFTDYVAIWFFQVRHQFVSFIDFFEHNGEHPPYYADVLKKKPYRYNPCILPPTDGFSTRIEGPSTASQLQQHGFRTLKAPYSTEQGGIQQARLLLPACTFNSINCKTGIEHLEKIRYIIDRKTGHKHDATEPGIHAHAADAFRYFAVSKGLWENNYNDAVNDLSASHLSVKTIEGACVWGS
jgi:hypothetical protein